MLGFFQVYFGENRVASRDVLMVDPTSGVLQETRKKSAQLTVTFDGIPDEALLDSPLLAEDILITYVMGWENGFTREDTLVIKTSDRDYGQTTRLTLTALDKGVALADSPTTETFTDFRASDLAIELARRKGLASKVDQSDVVYPFKSTAGDTLGQLLKDLADDEDFEFWIKKGTLYFMRSVEEGHTTQLFWLGGAQAGGMQLESFKASYEAVSRVGGSKRRSGNKGEDGKDESTDTVDVKNDPPDKAGSIEVEYAPGGGYRTREVKDDLDPNVALAVAKAAEAQQMATVIDGKKGHGRKHLDARNAAKAKFIRWGAAKCSGTVYGVFIEPRNLIAVSGVAKLDSGPWYMDDVRTSFENNDLKVSFSGIMEPKKRGTAKQTGADAAVLGIAKAAEAQQRAVLANAVSETGGDGSVVIDYSPGGGYRIGSN